MRVIFSLVGAAVAALLSVSAATAQTAPAVERLNPSDWLTYWLGPAGTPLASSPAQARVSSWVRLTQADADNLTRLGYYVRVANIDLGRIAPGAANNPDNVRRVERLMPRAAFEARFPNATLMTTKNGFVPGQTYSYGNFLKAVAALPGYCGDFSAMEVRLRTTAMADPDLVCKKMLTTTLAHAVQETSDGLPDATDPSARIAGTFASVAESNWNDPAIATPRARYFDAAGPFSPGGTNGAMVVGNYYYGRGAKQLSYPTNYANVSFLAYGTTLLVEQPTLVEQANFLPFYTALAYALTPKDGRISIAEAMDGTLSADIAALEANPDGQMLLANQWVANGTVAKALKFFDRGFSLTIALVNGGPECSNNPQTTTQTRTRIQAYARLAKGAAEGGLFATGFTPDAKDLMGCNDGSMPAALPPAYLSDAPFCLYGANTGACAGLGAALAENMNKGQGLDTISIGSPLFYKRRYTSLDTSTCNLVSYAGGVPIFGGLSVDQTYCPEIVPIDNNSRGAN